MKETILLIGPIGCGKTSIASFCARQNKSPVFSVDYAYLSKVQKPWHILEQKHGIEAVNKNVYEFYIDFLSNNDQPLLIDTSPRLYMHKEFWESSKDYHSIFLYQTPMRCIENSMPSTNMLNSYTDQDITTIRLKLWTDYFLSMAHMDFCSDIIKLSSSRSINCLKISEFINSL